MDRQPLETVAFSLDGGGMTSRTHPPSDMDPEAIAFGRFRSRRGRGSGLPQHHAIKAVAGALEVSDRTVRRWIANGDLVAHRFGGVVRIADSDLLAFIALHREG